MRNFILFIRRFSNLILFLLLEVVCVIFIARTNTMQGNDIMSSANVLMGSMYEQSNDVVHYFALKRMNDSLIAENEQLRKQIGNYSSRDTLTDSSATYAIRNADSTVEVKYADYTYRSAKVINNSIAAVNNYLTLNRGYKDGIRKDMAVISANGVVGRIVNTSAHYSTAISVISKKQQVSAKLKDGTVGYVSWNGGNPSVLIMKDIPNQIKVNKGDTVFTTEYSFFPADVPIGRVYKRELIKSKNLQILFLNTSTNFRKLQYVYVVGDNMAEERRELEAAAPGKK